MLRQQQQQQQQTPEMNNKNGRSFSSRVLGRFRLSSRQINSTGNVGSRRDPNITTFTSNTSSEDVASISHNDSFSSDLHEHLRKTSESKLAFDRPPDYSPDPTSSTFKPNSPLAEKLSRPSLVMDTNPVSELAMTIRATKLRLLNSSQTIDSTLQELLSQLQTTTTESSLNQPQGGNSPDADSKFFEPAQSEAKPNEKLVTLSDCRKQIREFHEVISVSNILI